MELQLTDNELWTEISSDNYRAYIVLYNRYWRKVYKTALFYFKDASLSEEITQDVFTVLWARRKFLKIEHFQNYLHMTTRYHVFKQLKAKKLDFIEYVETYEEGHVDDNMADKKIRYEDLTSELADMLSALPGRCKEIFWLSRVKQLTNDEIASQLGISKRTVENQLTHALKYLRDSYPKLALVSIAVIFLL